MKFMLVAAALLLTACTSSAGGTDRRGPSQLGELNHVFATVDPISARAIRDSAYLRRFANMEVRTTTGTRDTWTGRYLYGRQTYIEFFAPEDFRIKGRPAPIGAWGIAFSGDRPGFNAALARRLEAAGHKAAAEVETRKLSGRDVPWFEALTAVSKHGDSGDLDASASAWAMEYRPSYFDLPEAAREPAEGAHDVISRERYQSDLYATKMMRDVVEVHFNVGQQDYARIEPLLKAAGYHIVRTAGEVLADGAEADFRFSITAPAAQRLRRVRFVLNAPVRRHVEVIGNSTLVVGPDASATWTFQTLP